MTDRYHDIPDEARAMYLAMKRKFNFQHERSDEFDEWVREVLLKREGLDLNSVYTALRNIHKLRWEELCCKSKPEEEKDK